MKNKNVLALFAAAVLMFAMCSSVFADNLIIGPDGQITIESDSQPEQQEPADSADSEDPKEEEAATEGTPDEGRKDDNENKTDEASATEPDNAAPTIVKHPGSEYDHTAGDTVLFTAACSKDVSASWFFNDGVPISQIGSVYPGVSATVSPTIYNGTYPGSKVTISNLTRASSGVKIYVEFSTDYGVLKSNEAVITVTKGTDAPVPTAAPTPVVTTPAPTPAPTSSPVSQTPAPVSTPAGESDSSQPASGSASAVTPIQTPNPYAAVVTPAPVVPAEAVPAATYAPNENGSGYQYKSVPAAEWSVPGAKIAVAVCAIVAIIALLLLALYSMGAVKFRGLERLVGGKNYVDPDDEDDGYED